MSNWCLNNSNINATDVNYKEDLTNLWLYFGKGSQKGMTLMPMFLVIWFKVLNTVIKGQNAHQKSIMEWEWMKEKQEYISFGKGIKK